MKLLIISSNLIGDTILSTGVIEYFKKSYPLAKFTFIIGPSAAQIYINFPNLDKIISIQKETAKNYEITVNLAFNYSSKVELASSFNKISKNKLNKKITPKLIEKNLYKSKIPDPEILIRTGGKKRLSNFLLWQISYSEIFFIRKLWPDFKSNDLKKIIKEYRKIKRNFGGN